MRYEASFKPETGGLEMTFRLEAQQYHQLTVGEKGMLKNGLPKDGPQMTGWQQLRVFIFGVFELLVWMKKFKAQVKK
ncbi:DUF2500 family protein [Enterobacter cloacae]|nr:DUF2500 family protein [Enterobacter cloacae]